jgi:predicted amidophosphoribosyltransferase
MAGLPPDGPRPLGFGQCPHCPYLKHGTPEICFDCASGIVDQIPGRRCSVCDGTLGEDGRCGNTMCGWPVSQRGWRFVYGLAQRSGVLEHVINRYKYEGGRGWGLIFARLLVGYLIENFEPVEDHGLIVCSPTYVGPGGRDWDHTAFVLERARIEDDRWPFATNAIVKTGPTPKMVGRGWRERSDVARYQLAPLLQVPDPSIVAGKNVLVFDDVFTSGTTLREVALKLKAAGALDVDVVVLARQPFRG